MRNIKTPEGFAVLFDHDYHFRSGVGCVSKLWFHNPVVLEAFSKLFGTKEHEYIAAVEISREGIKAYFERKPEETYMEGVEGVTKKKVKRNKGKRK